jgi:hypothetical protein
MAEQPPIRDGDGDGDAAAEDKAAEGSNGIREEARGLSVKRAPTCHTLKFSSQV